MVYAVARRPLWKLVTASVRNSSISYLAHPNGKRVYIVDPSALVRKLETQGMEFKEAHAFVESLLNDSMVNVSGSFKMQNAKTFPCSFCSQQGHHSLLLKHEKHEMSNDIGKRLADSGREIRRALKEKFADSRHEICKALKEMLADSRREREMMGAQLEAMRRGVIKFCIGTLAIASAFGLAVVCKHVK